MGTVVRFGQRKRDSDREYRKAQIAQSFGQAMDRLAAAHPEWTLKEIVDQMWTNLAERGQP